MNKGDAHVTSVQRKDGTALEMRIKTVYRTCKRFIGAMVGFVCLTSKDGNIKVLFMDEKDHPHPADPGLLEDVQRVWDEACKSGGPVYLNDPSLESVLFVPMAISEGRMCMFGFAKPKGFEENDVRKVSWLTRLASMTLKDRRVKERTAKTALLLVFWMFLSSMATVLGIGSAHQCLASESLSKGMTEEALSLHKEAYKADHTPETHYVLGKAFIRLGEYERAFHQFSEALKDDPKSVGALYEIGSLMSRKGLYSDAILHYKKALAIDPNHVNVLYDLGVLYIKEMEISLAVAQFRRLLNIDPDNRMAANLLEYCERLGREGYTVINLSVR